MSIDKQIKTSDIECFKTIQDAIDYICSIKDNNNSMPMNVLITGSLHLVGGSLKIIKNMEALKERYVKENLAWKN